MSSKNDHSNLQICDAINTLISEPSGSTIQLRIVLLCLLDGTFIERKYLLQGTFMKKWRKID